MCGIGDCYYSRVEGVGQNQILSSWGAILDVHSLREVDAPQLPDLAMSLPPISLVTLSYTLTTPHHFITNIVSFLHFYPKTPEEIMRPMPINIHNNYQLSITYDVSSSEQLSAAKQALIRFGVLGPAENSTWIITITCQGIPDVNVSTSCYME